MQAVATDGPDTEPVPLECWMVELEEFGPRGVFEVVYTWTGYAPNSVEASHEARFEWFGISGRDARVRCCLQVGV